MYLNNFSVRIPEGQEIPGGYVQMQHGKQYRLILRNSRFQKCDARVEVDGKHVGTWRIPGNQAITLERPAHDHGRFTFYKSGSAEASAVGESEIDVTNRGLVKVTFTPEKIQSVSVHYTMSMGTDESWPSYRANTSVVRCSTGSAKGLSSGVTGLSGRSVQQFGTAHAITYDLLQQTVIHLRLVCEDGEPRPLTAFSTPVPPAV